MDARGANIGRRTSFSVFHIRREDKYYSIILIILTAVTIIAMCRHTLIITFYPAVSLPECSMLNLSGMLAFLALSLMPSVLQAEVALKWKYLQSKI